MATNMFLKINGIKGEAQDHKYRDCIEVLSWSWGMSQQGSMHVGTGGGSGRVSIHDLSITKWVDRSSPNLMAHCCSGKHFKEVLLIIRKSGGEAPVDYIRIKMENVLVSSVQTGGSGDEDRLVESISFNFGKVVQEYTPQNRDGSAGASIPSGWDIACNEAYDSSIA